IALTATDLHDESVQFELWQDTAALSEPKAAALQRAVDRVRAVTATGAPSSRAEAATAAAVEGSLAFASVPMQEVAPLRSRVAAAPVGMTSSDPSTSRSLRDRSGRDDTSQLNNDLPEGRVRRQQVVTTLGFVDRNHGVDHRPQRAGAEV